MQIVVVDPGADLDAGKDTRFRRVGKLPVGTQGVVVADGDQPEAATGFFEQFERSKSTVGAVAVQMEVEALVDGNCQRDPDPDRVVTESPIRFRALSLPRTSRTSETPGESLRPVSAMRRGMNS